VASLLRGLPNLKSRRYSPRCRGTSARKALIKCFLLFESGTSANVHYVGRHHNLLRCVATRSRFCGRCSTLPRSALRTAAGQFFPCDGRIADHMSPSIGVLSAHEACGSKLDKSWRLQLIPKLRWYAKVFSEEQQI
jgi:hypothetical protein